MLTRRKPKTWKDKARELAEEDRVEAATKEARRRFEEMRAAIAITADQVGDRAEEQWENARDAAAPRVQKLRKRASDVLENDVEWLRQEISSVSGDVGRGLVKVSADVRDASKAEANRIIRAIQENAEEVRAEERRRRVRALVGWTAFGMVAGAILANQFGPKSTEDDEAIALDQQVDAGGVVVAEDEEGTPGHARP